MSGEDVPMTTRRRFLQRAAWLAGGAAAWAACGGSDNDDPEAVTTLERTIARDLQGNLVFAPGEPYTVRTDLAQAGAGRASARRSLLVFHHLSDFRILDEESPLRAEWSDECDRPPNVTAFRPQETLSVQSAAALIAAANDISRSPVTGGTAAFAIHTGNAVDNAQYNELRWFLDLVDGKPVYPDSGAIGYQGVQESSPNAAYDDLLQTAQRQFAPQGLRYPWYAVAGARDFLVQGNFPPDERSQRFVVGAQKIIRLGPDALEEACSDAETLLGPASSATIFNDPETVIRGVGSDANRRLLSLQEWMAEHFATAVLPGPEGHGFTRQVVDTAIAYYVIETEGIAFVVLNTANPGGFSAGSIGEQQFRWLEEVLIARSGRYFDTAGATVETGNANRLIVVASSHPSEAMTNPFPGTDAAEPRYLGQDLEALLGRFPNVALHIAGHTLRNAVTAKPGPAGGYWQITTGSPLDSPMQGRLLEIVDNADGTLSIFSTVYDSMAPLNPGDADDPTPDDGNNERLLAGVSRGLAEDDPHRDPDAQGLAPSDRNAELLLTAPFDLTTMPTATPLDDGAP